MPAPEPAIDWLPPVTILVADAPLTQIDGAGRRAATPSERAALDLEEGAVVIWRANSLLGERTGERWGLGIAAYLAPPRHSAGEEILLQEGPITIGDVERALGLPVVGRDEALHTVSARAQDLPEELRRAGRLERLVRINRGPSGPIGRFVFTYRTDRLRVRMLERG